MTINLQINQAKQNITKAINDTNLPISIIRMIVDQLAQEVREAEYNALQQEAKVEREEKEREEQENNNEANINQKDDSEDAE